MSEPLRLADLLAGLSLVTDLGFGLPHETAARACLAATALARSMGLPESEVADAFYTALLEHVGCTAYAHETALAFGDELTMNATAARTDFADPKDMLATFLPGVTRGRGRREQARIVVFALTRGARFGDRYNAAACEVAVRVAQRLGLSEGTCRGLGEVGEWWNGKGAPRGLKGEEIAPAARIARVANQLVVFDDIGGHDLALAAVRRRAGGLLDPSVVAVAVAESPKLLDGIRSGDPRQALLDAEPTPVLTRAGAELTGVAEVFADLADLKTPFTHGHSRAVARLAVSAATSLGLDAVQRHRLEVAALLHDLGRVGVSDHVWEKQGPLTVAEWEQVRMHPYYSERILAGSAALAPMASLAGMHHERLDGSGYHRSCHRHELPVAARILAAADAYQAMTQERPHRAALSPDQAAQELGGAARAGRLDGDAVGAVLEAAGGARPRGRSDLRPAGLSDREIEVLRLVVQGLSNREVAGRLYISRRTAEHHVQHIYSKIGVSSRAGAALFAVEHELVA